MIMGAAMSHRRVVVFALLFGVVVGLTATAAWLLSRPSGKGNESLYLRARAHDAFRIIEMDREQQIQTRDQLLAALTTETGSVPAPPVSGASIRINPDIELWRNPENSPEAIAIISIDPSRRHQLAVTMGLQIREIRVSDVPSWAQ